MLTYETDFSAVKARQRSGFHPEVRERTVEGSVLPQQMIFCRPFRSASYSKIRMNGTGIHSILSGEGKV